MKLKRILVSVLLLALLACLFLCFSVSAVAEDAPQEMTALAYSVESEPVEETAQDGVAICLVAGCTVILAAAGLISINCQKIYDSEK